MKVEARPTAYLTIFGGHSTRWPRAASYYRFIIAYYWLLSLRCFSYLLLQTYNFLETRF